MNRNKWNRNKTRQVKKISKTAGIALFFGIVFLSGFLKSSEFHKTEKTAGNEKKIQESIKETIKKEIWDTHIPAVSFINQTEQETKLKTSILGSVLKQIPINQYLLENMGIEISIEDESTYELIIKSEGNDENHVDENGNIIPSSGDIGVEETLTSETAKEEVLTPVPENTELIASGEFCKATEKTKTYDWNQFHSFEELTKEFYAIDKSTMVDENQLNVQKLLEKDMKLKTANDKPQILIYHTHSQEAFADSIKGEEAGTVVGAGETLAGILRNEYGYHVIHDKGQYDVKSRDYAYSESAPALEKILADNPSIEVVIDLHRDGISGDKKLVTNLNGRQTAQFMFFNGLSRTRSRGEISYLPNPYVDDNLSFAFQMQEKCNEYYPGVTRKIYLKGYRYNMHYRAKSLLIELGAQTNTVEEIKNACDPIAHALHMVLSGE